MPRPKSDEKHEVVTREVVETCAEGKVQFLAGSVISRPNTPEIEKLTKDGKLVDPATRKRSGAASPEAKKAKDEPKPVMDEANLNAEAGELIKPTEAAKEKNAETEGK